MLACMVLPPKYHRGLSGTPGLKHECRVGIKGVEGQAVPRHGLSDWLQGIRVYKSDGRWHFMLADLSSREWDEFRDHLVSEAEGSEAKAMAHDQVEDARKNVGMGVHSLLCWSSEGPPVGDRTQACHFYCGRKVCLNPQHLCWGNHRDNAYHKWCHDLSKAGRVRANVHGEAQQAPHKHAPADWQPTAAKKKKKKKNKGKDG